MSFLVASIRFFMLYTPTMSVFLRESQIFYDGCIPVSSKVARQGVARVKVSIGELSCRKGITKDTQVPCKYSLSIVSPYCCP